LETPGNDAIAEEEKRVRKLPDTKDHLRLVTWIVRWPGEHFDQAIYFYDDLEKPSRAKPSGAMPTDARKNFDPAARQKRQFDQLVNFTQKLMRDGEQHRADTFWAKLDTSSVEKYNTSTEPFRKQLWEAVIGKLPAPTEPTNPRTRESYDTEKWKGYEVTLDL